LHRKIIGRVYHHFVRFWFGLHLRDVDCDFRLFRRYVLESIPLECDSGSITVEMMTRIEQGGFRVREIPVHHYHRAYGQSQFFNFSRVGRTLQELSVLWIKLKVLPHRRLESGSATPPRAGSGTQHPSPNTDETPRVLPGRRPWSPRLGFIGSNLAIRLLELGADVLVVDAAIAETGANLFNIESVRDHPRLSVRIVDVRDSLAMDRLVRNRDVIFNLAGQVSHIDSMRDPFTDLEINCRSQLALLESCRHNAPQAEVIFASTRQIYGRVPEEGPARPTSAARPTRSMSTASTS
jgi:hypothetical protein